jgi:hypothetical protein
MAAPSLPYRYRKTAGVSQTLREAAAASDLAAGRLITQ